MTQFFLVKVQRDKLVHSNRNADRWRRTALKNLVVPQVLWRAKRLRPVPRATIWVGVIKGNHSRYDPTNLTDTMKPVVDALVKANILPDDSHRFARGPWMMHLGVDKRLRDVVEFVVCIADWDASPELALAGMKDFAHPAS